MESESKYFMQSSHGGIEVAGWIEDQKIPVQFLAYLYHMRVLWWTEDSLKTSQYKCQGRLGMKKIPSFP